MKTYNLHVLFETEDKLAPEVIRDRNGEVVLSLCKVCGWGESELETPCTGVKTPHKQLDQSQQ